MSGWSRGEGDIPSLVRACSQRSLDAYAANPLLVEEHANIERSISQGGYGRRQLYELIQNGADQIPINGEPGRIHVLLTPQALYCANEGAPIDPGGVRALLNSHLSSKQGSEIGRFGLGFKSVLELTSRPIVYSRTGSFSFDGEYALAAVRSVVPASTRAPVLRVAEVRDPLEDAASDADLARLMDWASTIVVLPLREERGEWLPSDIAGFPREFLLFSAHVGSVILEDRIGGIRREIRLRTQNGVISLEESGEEPEVWRKFRTEYVPSSKARKEAGDLADRPLLPLEWAVPLAGPSRRGEFWAFFPTNYLTTLSGVLNAPWKTNEDRQNLLRSLINEELIDEASRLIVGSLRGLAESFPDDFGRHLFLLPGRGREAPNWADERLTNAVYCEAAQTESLPDLDGRLRRPDDLRWPPDDVDEDAHDIWTSCLNAPRDWIHFDALRTTDRRSRTRRIMEGASAKQTTLVEWLEALHEDCGDDAVGASAASILIAAHLIETIPPARSDAIYDANIVLCASGEWAPPRAGGLFVGHASLAEGLETVHEMLVATPGVIEALERLGVTELDSTSAFRNLLAVNTPTHLTNSGSWDQFWQSVREVGWQEATEMIDEWCAPTPPEDRLRVKTLSGDFQPISETLLPGKVLSASDEADHGVLVDVAYHGRELELLGLLGSVAEPKSAYVVSEYSRWFRKYRSVAVRDFLDELPKTSSRPQDQLLEFSKRPASGPLGLLESDKMSGRAKARYLELLLPLIEDDDNWVLAHSTRRRSYPEVRMVSPSVWIAKTYGVLETSGGLTLVSDSVGSALGVWESFFDVAECGHEAEVALGLPRALEEVDPSRWWTALERAREVSDVLLLGRFYSAAAVHLESPGKITCRADDGWRELPCSEVVALHSLVDQSTAIRHSIPFVRTRDESEAETLCREWGLRTFGSVAEVRTWTEPMGAPEPIEDRFSVLRGRLEPSQAALSTVACSALLRETIVAGQRIPEDILVHLEGDVLFYSDRASSEDVFDAICNLLKILPSESDKFALAAQRSRELASAKLDSIRRLPTLPERLLKAIGPDAIRQRLSRGLLEAVEAKGGPANGLQIARAAVAVFGVETLVEYADDLRAVGLDAPQQWAGGHAARLFVEALGFPSEYAGFPRSGREPAIEVEGPVPLPELHDFQRRAVANVRRIFESDERRGLLSMPTGSGKTRIAIEALAAQVAVDGVQGPIVWIAQSDELCEQAVQSWRRVWSAHGPPWPLRISRLWSSNDVVQATGGSQVVVATMQKLVNVVDDPTYGWLSSAQCVVIDEAHHAVSASYTRILDWFGLGRGRSARPLLGLTATAFRGGESETDRLAARFGRKRLDAGILPNDSYAALQDLQVLAHVDHEILDGAEFQLTDHELAQVEQLGRLPSTAEQRLGADLGRTEGLLAAIAKLPASWPVLVFATSVEHALTLAAILNDRNVRSAAIHGSTREGSRRFYVERFKAGEIQVLTNYGVLTTGFDAPAIRAIFVARPTFSPVLYQQMIGRGLRGPLNGGKERCLIVNVADTFRQFGASLAFREFDHLWRRRE